MKLLSVEPDWLPFLTESMQRYDSYGIVAICHESGALHFQDLTTSCCDFRDCRKFATIEGEELMFSKALS